MELDHDLKCPESEHTPQMRRHRHVAVPGEKRPEPAADRHPVEPRVGHRDRLHDDARMHRGAEKRALERQDAIAVVARALGEEDERIAGGEPVGDRVALLGGAAHLAVDKDAALHPGEPAVHRPARDLGLGDEARRQQRTQGRDVEIGDVVGDVERRPQRRRLAEPPHADAEEAAADAVVEAREGDRPRPLQEEADSLHRHQRQGPGEIGRQPPQAEPRRAHAI